MRELENILERAMITARTRRSGRATSALRRARAGRCGGAPSGPRRGRARVRLRGRGADAERARHRQALDKWDGNRTRAAEELGVSRRTILNKIKRYGL